MGEIDINGFIGMNNINPSFYAKKGLAMPRVVLNADVDASGKINKRDGLTPYISLPDAHSLWACEYCMLCAADGILYDISNNQIEQIATIDGLKSESLDYVFVEGNVYISNQYWNGIYNPFTKAISSWGLTLPNQPMLLRTDGNLYAGTYHVTFTKLDSVTGAISGNGQIASITLDADNSGIQVLNRPADALVWATDNDSYTFNLVGDIDNIVDIPTVEPLPSFMCSPPPFLTCLTFAFGRLWGVGGTDKDTLYYSEPYHYDWFKPASNFFKFNSDITLIAVVASGLFIGMADRTVFLNGTEPDQMSQLSAGAGSIKGTLAYCNNLPELGDVLGTPEKGFVDVPVWRTTEGIVAGNITGKLYNLTKHKVKMSNPKKGASLYRQRNGAFQFLTSSDVGISGSALGAYDSVLRDAVTAGQIALNNLIKSANTSVAGFSEDVSCELRRGGVLIE
jgi:hypothetical protein